MKLTPKAKSLLKKAGIALTIIIGAGALYLFNPTLRAKIAGDIDAINLSSETIDNIDDAVEIPVGNAGSKSPIFRPNASYNIGMYAWTGEFALIAANGGKVTAKGSLMEKQGISLKLTRQDSYDALIQSLVLFAQDFDNGNKYPQNDKAFNGVVAMGDGTPFFTSNVQRSLNDKFNGKYHVRAIAVIGISNGEDKIISPKEWQSNPQLAIGKVVSVVPGDGDWVLLMNWCALNNLPVNPNLGTYDPDAVNIWPSKDFDYVESAKELVQSQLNGQTFPMPVIKNGKRGETVERPIDACATWSPADELALSKLTSKGFTNIFSTKEASNQMPTTLYVIDEWAQQNKDDITKMLTAIYMAGNQIKQYDSWLNYASECAADVFMEKSPNFWRKIYESYPITENGTTSTVGGSRVFNLSDARQYLGMDDDGVNHFENVYNAVNGYIDAMGMREDIKVNLSYSDVVSHNYVASVKNINAGKKKEVDWGRQAKNVITQGNFDITFETGSATLLASNNVQLERLYNALAQASDLKIVIEGHTDNTGSNAINEELSYKRAQSVQYWLLDRGIQSQRIQSVEGFGSRFPIDTNFSAAGRAANRRVTVKLLN